MATKTRVIPPTNRSAVIREEHHAGMIGLRNIGQKVENGIPINEEVLGVSLLAANNIGTLDGVTAEENWPVKTDNVVITVWSVELGSKASRITAFVGEFTAKSDGRKTGKDWGL